MKRILITILAMIILTMNVYASPKKELGALYDTTYQLCEEYDVDFGLVIAVMWHESRCQPDVQDSSAGARGLMQIHPVNWDWLLDEGLDVNIPEQNIEAGIFMLDTLLEEYQTEDALAAYAAGEAGMKNGNGYWFADEIIASLNTEQHDP